MRSPFANCEARLVSEPATVKFRGEEYHYTHHCYECPETHERFTTSEQDDDSLRQVYDQYRHRYGIPTPSQIAATRQRYGVSARKLALILGFGENQIANYLDGEMPSRANGKVLAAIEDPAVFSRYLDLAAVQLSHRDLQRLKHRLEQPECVTA